MGAGRVGKSFPEGSGKGCSQGGWGQRVVQNGWGGQTGMRVQQGIQTLSCDKGKGRWEGLGNT